METDKQQRVYPTEDNMLGAIEESEERRMVRGRPRHVRMTKRK